MNKILLLAIIVLTLLLESVLCVDVLSFFPFENHVLFDGTMLFTGSYGIALLLLPFFFLINLNKKELN